MSSASQDDGWFKVAVDIPGDAESIFLSQISEFTASGVEVLGHEARALHPELAELLPSWVRLGVYALEDALEDVQSAMREGVNFLQRTGAMPSVSSSLLVSKIEAGWRDRWKSYFHVTHVTNRVVIRPTWESYMPRPGECILDMDPGAAFGTGGHATTRLCLMELDQLLPVSSLLDVGTGSGVLSIAAAKLGVSRIQAIDNDPTAVEVAEENVATNSVWDQVAVSGIPLSEIEERFQVVVANIIAPVLLRLAPDLVTATAAGGHVLLSGILIEEVDEVSRFFCELGMVEQSRDSENGWSCLHLRRDQS